MFGAHGDPSPLSMRPNRRGFTATEPLIVLVFTPTQPPQHKNVGNRKITVALQFSRTYHFRTRFGRHTTKPTETSFCAVKVTFLHHFVGFTRMEVTDLVGRVSVAFEAHAACWIRSCVWAALFFWLLWMLISLFLFFTFVSTRFHLSSFSSFPGYPQLFHPCLFYLDRARSFVSLSSVGSPLSLPPLSVFLSMFHLPCFFYLLSVVLITSFSILVHMCVVLVVRSAMACHRGV